MTDADLAHQANVLGALALVVEDRTMDAIGGATGQSGTSATALSALHHFLDRPTLDLLRQVLGLTPSGAVRLVDRLTDAGYVTRGPGGDRRSRSVKLTRKGRRAAREISEARAEILRGALERLTPAEQATLARLIGKLLAGFVRGPGAVRWSCRLCDTHACGRDAGRCPMANAARERYGS
ncbi:MAG: MarR family transcriptional regulator [Propionibacteriales bacterium]|nr:MarR family transcriptional regulator [Propionibacteriales bacterium]